MNDEYMRQLAEMEGYGDKEPGAQGTPEWLMNRVGHCTASRFADVMDRTKKGTEGAGRRNYRMELVVERLLGKPVDHFVTVAMQWGTDNEARARMAYEAHTGALVDQVGFIHHKEVALCGGSPDGLVGDDGGIEIKCPFQPAVHAASILNDSWEPHTPQIQGYMWITGRKWWDFVSYDPRLPEGLQLFVKRVPRDDAYIATLHAGVELFLSEVQEQLERLIARMTAGAPHRSPTSVGPLPSDAAADAPALDLGDQA